MTNRSRPRQSAWDSIWNRGAPFEKWQWAVVVALWALAAALAGVQALAEHISWTGIGLAVSGLIALALALRTIVIHITRRRRNAAVRARRGKEP